MDPNAGRLFEASDQTIEELQKSIPDITKWEYGERIEVKPGCWFEVTKIDSKKQRLVLKPIPKPAAPEADTRLRDLFAALDAKNL